MQEYDMIVGLCLVILVLTCFIAYLERVIKGLESKVSQLDLDISSTTRKLKSDITEIIFDKELLEKEQAKHEAHKLYQQTIKKLEEL